jgi:hypothetical protein
VIRESAHVQAQDQDQPDIVFKIEVARGED